MNIAIFGWYHHRNAGDDRIQYCLTRWLDGHTLAFLPAGRQPPIHLLRTYDAAIIGGGGLIMGEGGMFRHMTRWVKSAGIPVALVGVSVERVTSTLRNELREFFDICCFVWFRDQGSLEEIGSHPKAFVAPDVTWLYPFPLLPPSPTGVALCLRRQSGIPIEKWQRAVAEMNERVLPWPFYFEQGGDAALLQKILPKSAVPEEFQMDPLKETATVVSGRYHGLLFALQSGRPILAVSSLPKIRRFLAEHGLGEWCMAETEPEKLKERLQHLNVSRDSLLPRVLQLRSSLHEQATRYGEKARQLLLDAAASLPPPSRRWGNRVREMLDIGSYLG
jgi:polysaccharide pyruvyl transferase WcaK-like protein